jgi:hypothetical protein
MVASGVLCMLALMTTIPDALAAQSMWVNRGSEGGFALEYLRPAFNGSPDFTLLSGIYVVSFRGPMSHRVQLVGELPVVHTSYKNSFLGDGSSTDIGNLYVGLSSGSTDSGTVVETGIHLPIAGSTADALPLGMLGDYDRYEMYLPDVLALGVRVDHKSPMSDGLFTRLRFGPTVLFPTGNGGDTDVDLGYGFATGFENATTNVSIGVTGRWRLTGSSGSFGEKSVHQATLLGSQRLGPVRVGAQLRIPVDDQLDNYLERVLGLSVTLPFN